MNALMRRFSSVRVRLTLWNTLTFALVLVSLGVMFRLLAVHSLLNALDREIKMQAQRFQESHQVQMLFVSKAAPKGEVAMRLSVPTREPSALSLSDTRMQYKIVRKIGAPTVDQSGQFQYRSFDLTGKPLSPFALPTALGMALLNGEEPMDPQKQQEAYQPWDSAAFALAAEGSECFSTAEAADSSMRVFSLPLREGDKIVGVVQIATPLGQVYRDIAGLTRILLLILPLALLVSAGAGVFLTDRALRPVKSLTYAATRLHPDQLSQRLPISGADEFDQLAGTFNRALDRVERAFLERERMMEQLRRFTGDASHELRTPLTTIKTNTGVALTEAEPSQEHIHALRQIDHAADRMTTLVQDLLLLARSDAGQAPLDLRPLALHEVLREAMDLLPKRPHAPILLDAQETGCLVRGDSDQLCRLFLNLLENAARHTPHDGRIDVTLEHRGASAVVRIRDTGCGIAPEHLPHLGERFYRADAGRNRKDGGAGLGLAICRSIVARHQGEMKIESKVGKGTTVTVSIDTYSGRT